MKKLLIIVGMTNALINNGNSDRPEISNILKQLKKSINDGDNIIAFKDILKKKPEQDKNSISCSKGIQECQLIDKILPYGRYITQIKKDTINGFDVCEFQEYLNNNLFDEIKICGCCTDTRVLQLALSLKEYFSINQIKTKVKVLKDSVFSVDDDVELAKLKHEHALKNMQKFGVEIVEEQSRDRFYREI